MKIFAKAIMLFALLSIALSWGGVFEKIEQLREKEREIKEKLDFKKLKEFNIKDLINLESLGFGSDSEKFKHAVHKDADTTPHTHIDEFWTGFSSSLKLKKPTDSINCFGTVSGNLFFRKIRTMNDLLQHSKNNDNIRLHTDYIQLEMLMKALAHTHKCVSKTQDWEHLTDSLDISKDPEAVMNAKYLYYEAKYTELAEPFDNIVKEIDSGNFEKGGKLFGELFKKSVKDYKNTGEDLLTYQAFGNGLSSTLGVSLPSECLGCYNAKTAKTMMDFFKGLSKSVADGSWYKAEDSSTEYWKNEGKELLDKIPAKVWICDKKSKDSKEISEKIGIDIFSQEFKDKMWNYVSDHNIRYYSYIKSMNSAFEKHDYLHAGVAYAHLIEAVAKSS